MRLRWIVFVIIPALTSGGCSSFNETRLKNDLEYLYYTDTAFSAIAGVTLEELPTLESLERVTVIYRDLGEPERLMMVTDKFVRLEDPDSSSAEPSTVLGQRERNAEQQRLWLFRGLPMEQLDTSKIFHSTLVTKSMNGYRRMPVAQIESVIPHARLSKYYTEPSSGKTAGVLLAVGLAVGFIVLLTSQIKVQPRINLGPPGAR